MNGFLFVRLLVVVPSLVLAVALIARGNVLIGVIVGAIALSRLAMVVMVTTPKGVRPPATAPVGQRCVSLPDLGLDG